MITIYQVYKIQNEDDSYGYNLRYALKPFWRNDGQARVPWVPWFDSKQEAIEFINRQNRYAGEFTVIEVYTGQRPHEFPEPELGSYS